MVSKQTTTIKSVGINSLGLALNSCTKNVIIIKIIIEFVETINPAFWSAISSTEYGSIRYWTWSVLAADLDNDGYKDVMMTNGYLRDYTNMDFMKYYADQGLQEGGSVLEVVKKMPSTQVANYIFRNEQNLTFSNKQKEWGFDKAVISNGAVYADLDNDGDLEIITNNLNEAASVFKNLSTEQKAGNYLNIQLESEKKYDTKCYIFSEQNTQYQEFTPTHGYQSSMMIPMTRLMLIDCTETTKVNLQKLRTQFLAIWGF